MAKKKEPEITLNDGQRFHIVGNCVRGYEVYDYDQQDDKGRMKLVFKSFDVQECYDFRRAHGR